MTSAVGLSLATEGDEYDKDDDVETWLFLLSPDTIVVAVSGDEDDDAEPSSAGEKDVVDVEIRHRIRLSGVCCF